MKKFLAIAMFAMTLGQSPALAGDTEAIELKDIEKGKFEFDPQSGYIFLQGRNRQMGLLLKTPNAQDMAEYEAEWREKLEKEQKKFPRKLENWEAEFAIAQGSRARDKLLEKKPEEPTEENFSIGSIELRHMVAYGPLFVFSKDKENDIYTYMVKLPPGTYSYYGPVFLGPNGGYAGQCYCMGSVEFEAKAGVITDLGNFLTVASLQGIEPVSEPPEMKGSDAGIFSKDQLPFLASLQGNELTYGLPAELASYPSERADFRAARKRDNFFGITISRMPPIPGVLAYDNGQVVDVKAKAAAASSESTGPLKISKTASAGDNDTAELAGDATASQDAIPSED